MVRDADARDGGEAPSLQAPATNASRTANPVIRGRRARKLYPEKWCFKVN